MGEIYYHHYMEVLYLCHTKRSSIVRRVIMAEKITTYIKDYRKQIKMSQTELARRVGVRRETIGRLEKGLYNPSLKLALDISRVLRAKVEDLFKFKTLA